MRLSIFKNRVFPIIIVFVLVLISCGNKTKTLSDESNTSSQRSEQTDATTSNEIIVGANRTASYIPMLKGKRTAIVANQTSVIFKSYPNDYVHLVDSLVQLGVSIKKVFAPEHGFRGKADAGELVSDGVDTKTGIPIVSLYGKNKKPSKAQLEDLDVVVFDIQDVGARFYTYISSLHYVMEACAEANISVIVLDRPNPNGHYVDGPILDMTYKSFVGMHPIPVVHGMTIGEYAKMINGEKWLEKGIQCKLTVIPMEGYTHQERYHLPIKPSPNLPNDVAINLYPSLCFFEGTNVSAGRGTEMQFQIYGSPYLDKSYYSFEFIPKPNEGSKYPKHESKTCYGEDLSKHSQLDKIDLNYLIRAYKNTSSKDQFFIDFFTTLAGTTKLQQQIESGLSSEAIRESWKEGLLKFKATRLKYLLYE